MLQYKGHPIYGVAVPQAGGGWHCTGLVFEPEQKVAEIQRLECTDLIFRTKKQAEDHALKLCRSWIDARFVGQQLERKWQPGVKDLRHQWLCLI